MGMRKPISLVITCSCLMSISVWPLFAATVTYTYDSLNRITNVTYSTDLFEQFTYDANGNRLTSIVAPPVVAPDTTPPVLANLSPPTGSVVVTNRILVTGTATDSGFGNSGISGVTVNGTHAANETAAGSAIASWSFLASLFPGSNTLQIVAHDGSTNRNAVTNELALFYAMPSTQPPILAASTSAPGNPFSLSLYGSTNAAYLISTSTNLIDWTPAPITLVPTNGMLVIMEPAISSMKQLFYRAALAGPAFTSFLDTFARPDSDAVGNGWQDFLDTSPHHLVIRGQRLTTQTYTDATAGTAGVFRPMPRALPITLSAKLTDMNGNAGLSYRFATQIGVLGDGKLGNGYILSFGRSDSNYKNSTVFLNDGQTLVGSMASTFQFTDEIIVQATFHNDGSITGSVQGGNAEMFSFLFPAYAVQSAGSNVIIRLDMPDGRATGYVYSTVYDLRIE